MRISETRGEIWCGEHRTRLKTLMNLGVDAGKIHCRTIRRPLKVFYDLHSPKNSSARQRNTEFVIDSRIPSLLLEWQNQPNLHKIRLHWYSMYYLVILRL